MSQFKDLSLWIWRLMVPLKRLGIFLGLALVVALVYWWAINNAGFSRSGIIGVLLVWSISAYILLPRLHRFLTRFYVPSYFIGRARTADGLLADPVNMAVRGSEDRLRNAMVASGWQEADPLNFRNGLRTIKATLFSHSYANAPVSSLYVFGKKQDLAFQKEVDGNPAKRHHIRFWKTPDSGHLPGGVSVDWVAAATYDDAVGFSLFTLQITHSIDDDVDAERDFTVGTLRSAGETKSIERIDYFFPGYEHYNAGGHKFFTDGSMVIVDL